MKKAFKEIFKSKKLETKLWHLNFVDFITIIHSYLCRGKK